MEIDKTEKNQQTTAVETAKTYSQNNNKKLGSALRDNLKRRKNRGDK